MVWNRWGCKLRKECYSYCKVLWCFSGEWVGGFYKVGFIRFWDDGIDCVNFGKV